MSYLIKEITDSLRVARERKKLSQRALSKKVGLPQSHISRIENGMVDIQLSSLVELSRVLELEVMLVPRKLVPTVQGLIRSSTPSNQDIQRTQQIKIELQRIEKVVKKIPLSHSSKKEYEKIGRILKDIQSMPGLDLDVDHLISIGKEIKRISKAGGEKSLVLKASILELQGLRNQYFHPSKKLDKTEPAYSLDEDI